MTIGGPSAKQHARERLRHTLFDCYELRCLRWCCSCGHIPVLHLPMVVSVDGGASISPQSCSPYYRDPTSRGSSASVLTTVVTECRGLCDWPHIYGHPASKDTCEIHTVTSRQAHLFGARVCKFAGA